MPSSLSDFGIVGCKAAAPAHFSPASCPIVRLCSGESGKNWARRGHFSLSTTKVRQAASSEWNRQRAFTLIELLIALVIVGALLSVAVPTYQEYVERARRTTAIKDIAEISLAIERHLSQTGTYPNNLADLNPAPPLDPWGHAYQYLGIDVVPPPSRGAVRKDKNLNPLNSDYDLGSMGPDGQTQKPLTAAKARDDIVRAGNGGFIGLASEH